jgi:hypothetical protein
MNDKGKEIIQINAGNVNNVNNAKNAGNANNAGNAGNAGICSMSFVICHSSFVIRHSSLVTISFHHLIRICNAQLAGAAQVKTPGVIFAQEDADETTVVKCFCEVVAEGDGF